MVALIILAALAWVLQLVFGLWQMRRFTRHVKTLRAEGRVAIGKARGRFTAGAIVLLVLNEADVIQRGEVMTGVTVFARFRPFNELNGKNLRTLTASDVSTLPKRLRIAALSAQEELRSYEASKQENHKRAEITDD